MAKKFYAVKRGRKQGIFATWAECKAQVDGFERPVYKGFMSREEAVDWLGGGQRKPAPAISAEVLLYTDGSCLGNPGAGGWAAISMTPDPSLVEKHPVGDGETIGLPIAAGTLIENTVSGGAAETTNNRMELTAVIEGLRLIPPQLSVAVFTDSRYICDAFNRGWVAIWQRRRWRKATNEPVKNPELWQALFDLACSREVSFHWVRGHNANPYNERCDELARAEAQRFAQQKS